MALPFHSRLALSGIPPELSLFLVPLSERSKLATRARGKLTFCKARLYFFPISPTFRHIWLPSPLEPLDIDETTRMLESQRRRTRKISQLSTSGFERAREGREFHPLNRSRYPLRFRSPLSIAAAQHTSLAHQAHTWTDNLKTKKSSRSVSHAVTRHCFKCDTLVSRGDRL